MRILLTTDAVGGVWDYATTLQRRLVERGDHVLLAVLGRPTSDRLAALAPGADWVARPFPLEWDEGGVEAVERAAHWIAELADRMRADVVHLNQLAYAHRLRHPVLTAVHSDAWSWFVEVRGRAPDGEPRWRAYRDAVVRGLEASSLVVTPSRYQARLVERQYGRRVDHVVRNGVDRESFARRPAPPEPAPAGPTSFVTIGRAWDPAKGLAVVDEALDLVRAPWTGYHAGDLEGPEDQRMVPRRLRALGRLPRHGIRQLLGRSSVYVAASYYEPFGLAPLEAAMSGCALVLADIGSFRELWDGDALYFDRGDAASLARALDRLHADPALHHDLRLRAMQRAWSRFDDRQMAARYARLYETLRGGVPEGRERAAVRRSAPPRTAPRISP